ncbi:MAG: hypothetical protein V1742_01035 [Pseudomonadota bacterium]
MTYRTCKRCSVTRVNCLCDLYERAFNHGEAQAEKNLAGLCNLANHRGLPQARELLVPGLAADMVRALSWNVSSLLTDEDMARLGLPVGKGK